MGSIGKVVITLGETRKKTKFTPPSPTKATPNDITSNKNYLSMTSVSNGDDVSMTSSTKNEIIKLITVLYFRETHQRVNHSSSSCDEG